MFSRNRKPILPTTSRTTSSREEPVIGSGWIHNREKYAEREQARNKNVVRLFVVVLIACGLLSMWFLMASSGGQVAESNRQREDEEPSEDGREANEKQKSEEKERERKEVRSLSYLKRETENEKELEREREEARGIEESKRAELEKEVRAKVEKETGRDEKERREEEEREVKGEEKRSGVPRHQHVRNNVKIEVIESEHQREAVLSEKREAVRNMLRHAWKGYFPYMDHDEVLPVTNTTNDSWGGMGITLVDALDTLHLLGMTEELSHARQKVEAIQYERDYDASFFETTIRHLGGLLSIYHLTKDELYLRKARELGDALYPAFSSPTGIPYSIVNLKTKKARNPKWTGGFTILSEIGTIFLEFASLSHFTGDPKYKDAAEKVNQKLALLPRTHDGLFPVFIDNERGMFQSNQITFGGLSDSFYEYLLKNWVISGGTSEANLKLYQASVQDLRNHLIHVTHAPIYESDELQAHYYIGQLEGTNFVPMMEHLACFTPGMLALGHHLGATPSLSPPTDLPTDADLLRMRGMNDLDLAKELMHTCVDLYMDQVTGIGPERVKFHQTLGENRKEWYSIDSASYYLRPETIESLYLLYSITGDPEYQEIGWQIFQSIEKYCKTPIAYSAIQDVTLSEPRWTNSMQSYFFAETIKYLFLLFSPRDTIRLDEMVFNTEGHPLPIWK